MFHWIVLMFVFHSVNGLKVNSITSANIETYLTLVDFEGIRYQKRELNTSAEAFMSFRVSPVKDLNALSLEWFLESNRLTVVRVRAEHQLEKDNVYSTESLDKSTLEATITLNLRNKGLSSGNYTLIATVDGVSASGSSFASAAPILPLFPKTKRVLEGDVLRLMCNPAGYPKPEAVYWSFFALTVEQMEDSNAIAAASNQLNPLDLNASHYELQTSEGGVSNDTLRFSRLLMKDNGLYACNVSNMYGSDFTYVLVNVKDRWAALWPFIGIVIEVTVLVTAILLYERHQMRSKPNKLEVNPGPQDVASAPAKQPAPTIGQQQQNSAAAAPDALLDNDTNKRVIGEMGDQKVDDVRQRGTSRC